MTRALSAFAVLLAIAAAISPQERARAPLAADAVWKPPADFLAAFHAACDRDAGTDFGACFLEQMRKAGAGEPALSFARRTEEQGYLVAFAETGLVDVAWAEYPFRANENRLVFLVNGEPPMIDVDDLTRIDRANLDANPVYAGLKKAFSDLALFPADRSDPRDPRALPRPDGGQRFVVVYELHEGCHACRLVGYARIGFDFDARGRFLGTDAVQVRPRYR